MTQVEVVKLVEVVMVGNMRVGEVMVRVGKVRVGEVEVRVGEVMVEDLEGRKQARRA